MTLAPQLYTTYTTTRVPQRLIADYEAKLVNTGRAKLQVKTASPLCCARAVEQETRHAMYGSKFACPG